MTLAKTAPESDESATAQKVSSYMKVGIPAATLAAAIGGGVVLGPPAVILALAGGALVGVIATFWASVRTLFGETPLSGADAYALGAPRAEEEQKQAVLRALKDLEFERSVGKISEEDYQALVAKYRAEARRLLRLLDADALPRRAHVEALVAKRLRREGLLTEGADAVEERGDGEQVREEGTSAAKNAEGREAGGATPGKKKRGGSAKAAAKAAARARKSEPATETDAAAVKDAAASTKEAADTEETIEAPATKTAAVDRACSSCGTINDEDAVFCKKCGARQTPPADEAAARGTTESAETPESGAGA